MRNLLNAWNQTATVMCTVSCTLGHVPYTFNAYCVNKTTSSVHVQNTDRSTVFV